MTLLEQMEAAEVRLRKRGNHDLADRLRVARDDVAIIDVIPSPEDEKMDVTDTQTLLKDKSDVLIAILSTMRPKAGLPSDASRLYEQVKSLQSSLKSVGKELMKTVKGSKADPELEKALDQSDVGAINTALQNEAQNLNELLTCASLLKNYTRRAAKAYEEGNPVKHKLPKKDRKQQERSKITPEKKEEDLSFDKKLDDVEKLL